LFRIETWPRPEQFTTENAENTEGEKKNDSWLQSTTNPQFTHPKSLHLFRDFRDFRAFRGESPKVWN
jgi:hypothetical protein